MNPTLSTTEIERLLKLARAASLERSAPEGSPIVPVERGGRLALSFAQQRLWFLEQLGELGSTYHIPMRLRLRGALDRAALGRALQRIVARHESLRTVFVAVDGEPEQRILPVEESGFGLVEHDLRGEPRAEAEVERLVAAEAEAPFDLQREPLVRAHLVRLADDDHLLLVTMHHVVSDAWSMGVFTRELRTLYTAFSQGQPDPLPALPVQYADYAAWQRRLVKGDVLDAQAEYWTRTLAGAPELLELPTDHARPARQDHAGATLRVELGPELTAGLTALGHRHGTTLYMTLLAGWATVLARLSGQDDVVVGTPSANRARPEVEELIGFFVNTLALRVDLSARPTVAELLAQVKTRAMEGQRNQDIPFEQVVERLRPVRSLAYSPLFQVMFAWQTAGGGRALELPGLTLAPADAAPQVTAKFDLLLSLWEDDGRIAGAVQYATSLFEPATVERWWGYLRRVLEEMVADDSKPVSRLELLGDAERALVLEAWNRTERPYPRGVCIHELFEAQVRERPDAVALVWGGAELTYQELAARANRLAHHLAGLGVGPESRVGVMLERGVELIVSLLAVLKAGGCYVPLDPGYPAERLRLMLEDSGVRVLLSRGDLAGMVEPGGVNVVHLDRAADAIASEPIEAPRGGVTAENLAYIVYTSGSTGRPKGVMVGHRQVVQLVVETDYVQLRPGDRVAQASNAGFDALTFEVWGAFLNGATLVGIPQDVLLSPPALRQALREERITTVFLTTALVNQLAHEEPDIFAPVREVLFGGQAVDAESVRRLLKAGGPQRLLHMYGPTETTTFCLYEQVEHVAEDALTVPLGHATGNQRIYLLDGALNPVPLGVPGEAYVGGGGVSRGYLDRPGLTAERFIPDPFSGQPGARMYRTGDRMRWRGERKLEFVGRLDEQVKIRGFRVEPGEIEARLLEHVGVRGAVVTVREDPPGDRRLVAYYLADEPVAVDALKAHLSDRLPGYMVPAAYVWMDALPLTPNGKVDRQALPAPEGDAFATRGYEAPSGEAEQAVAAIWVELLGAERVGRGDHFFELGGHSLLAVRVVSRVRQELGVEVSPGDLFERPVLADFARGLELAARAEAMAITPVDRSSAIPLSFAQQRLWFLEQLGGTGAAYHVPMRLRLRGGLDHGALERALDRIVARHEALRTTFPTVDGEPVQHIVPAGESGFHVVEHDLRASADAEDELRRLMSDEASAPFDLARGPLIRARLIRMAADDHVLLLTMHHIVADGWSAGVLFRELGALYAAFARGEPDPLPPLPVQYADYAAWHRRQVEGPVLEAQAEYWTRTLAGAPELLELPADRPRPARQDFAGASLQIELDEALTAALKTLSQRHGATLFMTLLAGWAAVLARLSGQDDVVIGTPSANRGRSEIEGLIGFFVNTLPVRVDLSDGPGVAELLQRVKTRALEAQRNQDIPLEQVVELVQPVRSLAHTPLFQVLFAWQNAPGERLELPGLAADPLHPAGSGGSSPRESAKFDLTLTLAESGDRIVGVLNFATALFNRATVERWVGYLRRVLEAMATDERQPVERLALMPESERFRVVEEWSAGDAAPPAEQCIHALFEAQAARTPGATALVHEGERLTYAELDARANRLAHRLAAAGVERGVAVGVCLEWSPELVVALLATLKAGGVYVPLDPSLPAARLAYIAEDAGLRAVVTRAGLAERVPPGVAVRVDVDAAYASATPAEAPRALVSPEDLAYVIYTSGSTGRPKGVAVEHGAAAAHLTAVARVHGIVPEDRVLQFASAGFDVSLEQVFFPLLTGATLVLRGAELWSAAEFQARVRALGITVANLPPAYWQEVVDGAGEDALAGIRLLLIGGDALPASAADSRGARRLVNCYGPTETVVTATAFAVERGAAGGPLVPIGRPLPGRTVYVLDPNGAPVPVGVAGELYIGGPLLARGYLGRPALTAERFVPDPFGRAPGGRLYRTGDRVRWRESAGVRECVSAGVDSTPPHSRTDALTHSRTAVLEFLGRTDFQVKIRGFRIELGEIEAGLRSHPAVRDAVVLAREDAPGDRRLAAYYLASEPVAVEALKAHLAGRLPEHMVPAAYVWMETYPLTPNGKLDRKALPAPEGDAYASQEYQAPEGETEQAMAAIWADLLGVERVGRHDHFFHLGGNSLLATRLVFRISREMDVELPVSDVFEKPELSLLAQQLLDAQLAQFDPDQLQGLLALTRAADVG